MRAEAPVFLQAVPWHGELPLSSDRLLVAQSMDLGPALAAQVIAPAGCGPRAAATSDQEVASGSQEWWPGIPILRSIIFVSRRQRSLCSRQPTWCQRLRSNLFVVVFLGSHRHGGSLDARTRTPKEVRARLSTFVVQSRRALVHGRQDWPLRRPRPHSLGTPRVQMQ